MSVFIDRWKSYHELNHRVRHEMRTDTRDRSELTHIRPVRTSLKYTLESFHTLNTHKESDIPLFKLIFRVPDG